MRRNNTLLCSLLLLSALLFTGCRENLRLFAGGEKKGLFVFDFDERKGDLTLVSEYDAGPNPSYFCFSQEHSMIYALNEVMDFRDNPGGGVTTLKYDPKTGSAEKINEISVPFGGPCFISLSADSSFLFLANYASGSVAVVRLDANGIPQSVCDTIKYNVLLPEVSHPHMILQDPSGKHVYITDLGLDRIMIYDFDSNSGKLSLPVNGIVNLPKGSGPRHFVFNSDRSKMYVINEPGSSIMVLNPDEKEGLKIVQILPSVSKGYEGKNYCAEILIGKDGDFLYGSNRGENTIVTFRIAKDGTLSLAGHVSSGGEWPRSFVIDPSGKFLLAGNQKSDDISVFKINKKSGIPEGPINIVKIKSPVCLVFRE